MPHSSSSSATDSAATVPHAPLYDADEVTSVLRMASFPAADTPRQQQEALTRTRYAQVTAAQQAQLALMSQQLRALTAQRDALLNALAETDEDVRCIACGRCVAQQHPSYPTCCVQEQ